MYQLGRVRPQQACCPCSAALLAPAIHLLPVPAATRLDFKSVGEWFKMRLNQEEERRAGGQKRPAEEEAEGQPAPQRLASEGRLGRQSNLWEADTPLESYIFFCKAIGRRRPAEEGAEGQLAPL